METSKPYRSVVFPEANLPLPFWVDIGAISSEISLFPFGDRSIRVVSVLVQPSTSSFSFLVSTQVGSLLKNTHSFFLLSIL